MQETPCQGDALLERDEVGANSVNSVTVASQPAVDVRREVEPAPGTQVTMRDCFTGVRMRLRKASPDGLEHQKRLHPTPKRSRDLSHPKFQQHYLLL